MTNVACTIGDSTSASESTYVSCSDGVRWGEQCDESSTRVYSWTCVDRLKTWNGMKLINATKVWHGARVRQSVRDDMYGLLLVFY